MYRGGDKFYPETHKLDLSRDQMGSNGIKWERFQSIFDDDTFMLLSWYFLLNILNDLFYFSFLSNLLF